MLNRKKLSQIKCIVVEVDGILTDGKTWLNHQGLKQRKFSVRDSMAIRRLLKAGYSFAVATSTPHEEIVNHFNLIGVRNFIDLSTSKDAVTEFLKGQNVQSSECACLIASAHDFAKNFETTVTVSNAADFVRTSVQHVTGTEAGDGALAEFAQLILEHGYFSNSDSSRKAASL